MDSKLLILVLFTFLFGCDVRFAGYSEDINGSDAYTDIGYIDTGIYDTVHCEEYRCESFFEVKENIYMDKDSGNLYMLEYSFDKMIFSKYNKDGVILWSKAIIGIGECLRLEYVDKDENFYISQDKKDCIPKLGCSCAYKHILYKYKKSGNGYEETFKVALPRSDLGDRISSIALDEDGNLYVIGNFVADVDFGGGKVLVNRERCKLTGNPNAPVKCFTDVFVVRYNRDGDVVWAKGIGGGEDDSAWNGYISDDGLILQVSHSSEVVYIDNMELNIGNNGRMIIKLDRNGEYKWSKFSALGYEYMTGIDKEGNIYFYGYYDSMNNENNDLFLIKYDKNGELVWSKKVEIREIQSGYELLGKPYVLNLYIDKYQNIYVLGGFTIGSITDFRHFYYKFLSKYNQKGDKFWYKDIIESRFFGLERISGIVNGDIYLVLISYNRNPVTIDNCSINDISEDLSYKYYLLKFTPEGCSSVEAYKLFKCLMNESIVNFYEIDPPLNNELNIAKYK